MTTLALDLGTKTGWLHGEQSGTKSFALSAAGAPGERFRAFYKFLDARNAAKRITEVFYEDVKRHIGTQAAHVYGGLKAVLLMWCENQSPRVPYTGVGVGTIKKFATGSGSASKAEMIAQAIRWGFKPKDDNEADAIALGRYAASLRQNATGSDKCSSRA